MAFDPYESWLGIPADRRPPTHYDLLGLSLFESEAETIEQAALRRMSRVRQHQLGPHSDLSQEILAELARARLILMDPDRRADYDAKIRRCGKSFPSPPDSPASPKDWDAKPQPSARVEAVPDVLKAIDVTLPEIEGTLTARSATRKPSGAWKRAAVTAVVVAIVATLFGWAYLIVYHPRSREKNRLQVARYESPAPSSELKSPNESARPAPLSPKPIVADRGPDSWHKFDGKTRITVARSGDFDMTSSDYTIYARIRTRRGGTIFSKTAPDGPWVPDGKSLFIRDGKLAFIGWAVCVESGRRIDDGEWHDVAMTFGHASGRVNLFVDGKPESEKALAPKNDARGHVVRIGYTVADFPYGESYFVGDMSEIRFYTQALSSQEITDLPTKSPNGTLALACWMLKPVLGTSIADETANGHTATPEPVAVAMATATNGEELHRRVPDTPQDPALDQQKRARRPAETSRASAEFSTASKHPTPASNPGGSQKKALRRHLQLSNASIRVRPVFFVPAGEAPPTPNQTERLQEHLVACQTRYWEMLHERATFSLVREKVPVHRSPVSLTTLKQDPDRIASRVAGELLTLTKTNRFTCNAIFVAVVMNADGSFPAVEGAPFNGGFNLGGGVVVLSSFALDKLPSFQSTLQHQLGHASGLPDVSMYGHDMSTSDSIMSNNPLHDTRWMEPSAHPGLLIAEDVRGLSFNKRVFPKLHFNPARDGDRGRSLSDVVTLRPMTIDGQAAYTFEVNTDSGETWGTRVSNLVQNKIWPSEGGKFVSDSMWHSRPSAGGWVALVVTFPVPITLTAIGIHSQHSGVSHAADALLMERLTRDGMFTVVEGAVPSVDAIVPLPEPASGRIWRISLHSRSSKEVTLRGLRFITPDGEIFPPSIPYYNDKGEIRWIAANL